MSFYEEVQRTDWAEIEKEVENRSAADVESALSAKTWNIDRFLSLLSPAAEPYLEEMAQRAHLLTQQRFGKVMSLFAPLYVSNFCTNRCAYCGFNAGNPVDRLILTPEQARVEGEFIHAMGFRHLLLVCGEAPRKASLPYLTEIVDTLRPLFPSIAVEIYPMGTEEYRTLIAHGVDGLTVFQETYNSDVYARVHLGGKKRDYRWRLETPDRGGEAGFRKIGLGALLGLGNWRVEGFYLGLHSRYLMRRFWKSQVSISFPRLCPAAGGFQPLHPISDLHLVQLLTALRLFLPDAGFTLSTRESPSLRDHLVPMGITSMSAGSKTGPGGYARENEAEKQFEVADHRSPDLVAQTLRQMGYEPVWKDWDCTFLR